MAQRFKGPDEHSGPHASLLGNNIDAVLLVDLINVDMPWIPEHHFVASRFPTGTVAGQVAGAEIGFYLYDDPAKIQIVLAVQQQFAK